jgi:hypothetical protein
MADAHTDETVYLPTIELLNNTELWGEVGVVVYSKTFAVNGVQIWMVPK